MEKLFAATIETERFNRGIFDLVNVLRPLIVEHNLNGESVGMRRNTGGLWQMIAGLGMSQFMIISTNEAFIDALCALPANADGNVFDKITEAVESIIDTDQGVFMAGPMTEIGLFGDEGATDYIALRDRIAAEDAANAPLTDAELTEVAENIVSPVSAPIAVSFNGAQLSGAELAVIDEPEDEEFEDEDEDEDDDWYDDEEDDDLFDDDDDDFYDDDEDWEDEDDYEDD